jgi:predicted RNase H-like HicB family nuclease
MENSELDDLRQRYKDAVEQWVSIIRDEEALATPDHSISALDVWESAGFREEEARSRAKEAKAAYEDALRRVNFKI